MWDSNSTPNIAGDNLVAAMIENPDITMLTPCNFPTYYHMQTNNFSTLDLCLISNDLFSSSNIELGDDIGSDHSSVGNNKYRLSD